VLATNQLATEYPDKNNYNNYEQSIVAEQRKVESALLDRRELHDISRKITKSEDINSLASWWLAKAYFAEPKPPDIVILGDSQLGPIIGADTYVDHRPIDIVGNRRSHLLENDFRMLLNKQWRVFIGALPEAMISDELVISRALFSTKYKPKLVAITFSPKNFIDNCFPSPTSTEPFAVF
jgi:hypothetical protein